MITRDSKKIYTLKKLAILFMVFLFGVIGFNSGKLIACNSHEENDGLSGPLPSPPLVVPEANTGFQAPLSGSYSNNGGHTFLTYAQYSGGWIYHPAEDWNQPSYNGGCGGTGCNYDECRPVLASANGTVVYVNPNSWGGIVIQHLYQGQTWYTQYGHVRNISVSMNQNVTKGQQIAQIGRVGADCAHLHFEVREADHPNPTFGPYWQYGSNGLGNQANVNNWYEDPDVFIAAHPAYTNTPTALIPNNNATNISIPVFLDWSGTSGSEYRIQISRSASGWSAQNGFSSGTSCSSTLVVNKNTGTSSSFNWSATTSGVCFTAQPNTTYYWTVKAYTPSGGNSFYTAIRSFTTTASGTIGSTPTNVSASDGNYADRVHITWTSSAPYKKVWRNTSSSTSGMVALTGWITANSFDDFNASPGVTYYYRVQAANSSSGSGASAYSSYDSGYRASASASTPTGVNASDGTYPDRVRITWTSSAAYKRVFRGTSSNISSMTNISGWITSNSYNDFTALPGVIYYYRIQAANSNSGSGASGYSTYNTGFRTSGMSAFQPSTGSPHETVNDEIASINNDTSRFITSEGMTALILYPNPLTEGQKLNIEIYSKEKNERPGSIIVYSVTGTLIQNITTGRLSPGRNLFYFSTTNLLPGAYLCTLQTENYRETQLFKIVK